LFGTFKNLVNSVETSTIENQIIRTQSWLALVIPFHQVDPKSGDLMHPCSQCDGGNINKWESKRSNPLHFCVPKGDDSIRP
jgi:hypothetical protein